MEGYISLDLNLVSGKNRKGGEDKWQNWKVMVVPSQ